MATETQKGTKQQGQEKLAAKVQERMKAPIRAAVAKVESEVQRAVQAKVDELQVTELVKLAQDKGLQVSENSGFYRVEGKAKGLRLYAAKRGSRLDLSGFSITHPSVKAISEAEAKARRIGKARGQVLNALRQDFRAAYQMALPALAVASAVLLMVPVRS